MSRKSKAPAHPGGGRWLTQHELRAGGQEAHRGVVMWTQAVTGSGDVHIVRYPSGLFQTFTSLTSARRAFAAGVRHA